MAEIHPRPDGGECPYVAKMRAFVDARVKGDEELTSFDAACEVGKLLGRPSGLMQDTVRLLLKWAREHQPEWFERLEVNGDARG